MTSGEGKAPVASWKALGKGFSKDFEGGSGREAFISYYVGARVGAPARKARRRRFRVFTLLEYIIGSRVSRITVLL